MKPESVTVESGMSRINEIVRQAARAGIADWEELYAIIAAVETVGHNLQLANEATDLFKWQYGTVAATAVLQLVMEPERPNDNT